MTRIKITLAFLLPGIWGLLILCSTCSLWAAANGSLSGTLTDPSGAVVPGATITLINTAFGSEFKAVSNATGILFVSDDSRGSLRSDELRPQDSKHKRKTNLTVDTDAALKMDVVLQMGQRTRDGNGSGHRSGRLKRKSRRWQLVWANS